LMPRLARLVLSGHAWRHLARPAAWRGWGRLGEARRRLPPVWITGCGLHLMAVCLNSSTSASTPCQAADFRARHTVRTPARTSYPGMESNPRRMLRTRPGSRDAARPRPRARLLPLLASPLRKNKLVGPVSDRFEPTSQGWTPSSTHNPLPADWAR